MLYCVSNCIIEMNQYFMFCNSGLLSKTNIFIVHTSSHKKLHQFCTVFTIKCLELIVIQNLALYK